MNWWGRSFFEFLYFLSGPVVAVAAIVALKQISVTKRLAKRIEKRESLKLASDMCKYFADVIVPLNGQTWQEYNTSKYTFLLVSPSPTPEPPFVIEKGQLTKHRYDLGALQKALPQMTKAINLVNSLEGFGIPFAANLADNEVGYQETGRAFCQMANQFMPVIVLMKARNDGQYRSVLEMFSRWNPRVVSETAAPALRVLQDLKKQVDSQKHNNPFGNDDEDDVV